MSFSDWDSDLTDISSSSEDEGPIAQTLRIQKPKREYAIKNSLRPPRTVQFSAKSLYEQIIDNTIELDPEYQRGRHLLRLHLWTVVWPETKMSHLIDSVLRNYYIPPVIFAVTANRDGSEHRVCIDGKQRLTSIQRFMDGLIPHRDSHSGQKLWYKQLPGATKKKLLPKGLLQLFANKQIVCVEYESINGDQEREIFQRVQLGVALTPAERMQATTGDMATLVRQLQSEVLGKNGLDEHIEWDRTRGRDFHCIASIAYLVEKFPHQSHPDTKQLEKWLSETEVTSRFRNKIAAVFQTFLDIVRDKNLCAPLRKPTRVSPIEFVMSGVLVAAHRDKLSLAQLSSAIEKLREDVRAKERDIRLNQRTTKHMFNFITKKVELLASSCNSKGDVPASKVGSSTLKPPKRKRQVVVSDDEDEDKRRKVSTKGSTVKPAASRKTAGTSTFVSTAPKPTPAKVAPSKTTTKREPNNTTAPSTLPRTHHDPPRPPKVSTSSANKAERTSAAKPKQEPGAPPRPIPAPPYARSLNFDPGRPPPATSQPTPPAIVVKRESPAHSASVPVASIAQASARRNSASFAVDTKPVLGVNTGLLGGGGGLPTPVQRSPSVPMPQPSNGPVQDPRLQQTPVLEDLTLAQIPSGPPLAAILPIPSGPALAANPQATAQIPSGIPLTTSQLQDLLSRISPELIQQVSATSPVTPRISPPLIQQGSASAGLPTVPIAASDGNAVDAALYPSKLNNLTQLPAQSSFAANEQTQPFRPTHVTPAPILIPSSASLPALGQAPPTPHTNSTQVSPVSTEPTAIPTQPSQEDRNYPLTQANPNVRDQPPPSGPRSLTLPTPPRSEPPPVPSRPPILEPSSSSCETYRKHDGPGGPPYERDRAYTLRSPDWDHNRRDRDRDHGRGRYRRSSWDDDWHRADRWGPGRVERRGSPYADRYCRGRERHGSLSSDEGRPRSPPRQQHRLPCGHHDRPIYDT